MAPGDMTDAIASQSGLSLGIFVCQCLNTANHAPSDKGMTPSMTTRDFLAAARVAPAASAEDAPVALHTRLREMSDHMLNATALTGAELIHMSIAMTESADELDRLTAANEHWEQSARMWREQANARTDERDALQARLDAAELDAKRYRWLRDHPQSTWQHMGVPIRVFRCDVPIVMTGELPADLSAAIDAAMGADKGTTP